MITVQRWLGACALACLLLSPSLAVDPPAAAPDPQAGIGLLGEYYQGTNFETLVLTRRDAQVQFGWGEGSPDPRVWGDNFSIRWVGKLRPKFSETYTFSTGSDDESRMYVNGKPLYDYNARQGNIDLEAGKLYDITIEYVEHGGQASITFFWTSKSQPYGPVPSAALYPPILSGTIAFADNTAVPRSSLYAVGVDLVAKKITDMGAVEPSFSPDGRQLLYTSGNHANWVDPKTTKNTEIYLVNADGSKAQRMTNLWSPEAQPRYSPDGKKIVYTSRQNGNWEIYIMNAGGGRPTRLTNSTATESYPCFSPDSSQIVFQSDSTGRAELYLMNVDGTEMRPLTTDGGEMPAYSPDGTRIAFISSRDGNRELYLMKADGSEVTRLTKTEAAEIEPTFSPDGLDIAFVRKPDEWHGDVYLVAVNGSFERQITTLGHCFHPTWGR